MMARSIPFPCSTHHDEQYDQERLDVNFGRGGLNNQLRKGTLYRKLIQKYSKIYSNLGPKEKRDFARTNIVDVIRQHGGRFFNTAGKQLFDVDRDILPKVMQAFRDEFRMANFQTEGGGRTSSYPQRNKKRNKTPQKRTTNNSVTTDSNESYTDSNAEEEEDQEMETTRSSDGIIFEGDASCFGDQSQEEAKGGQEQEDDQQQEDATSARIATATTIATEPHNNIEALSMRVKRLEGLVCFLMKENEFRNSMAEGRICPV